ncbi:MAG: hypothetical protein WAL20_06795, partial [Rhodomicrobium sp.]
CVARLISAAIAAPYVVRHAGVLMPARNRLLACREASEGKAVRVVDHKTSIEQRVGYVVRFKEPRTR